MHFVKIRAVMAMILFCTYTIHLFGFKPNLKFSNDFYAAQKYFFNQAKSRFPKLTAEKMYPEVPIRGAATSEELKMITPLLDYFEARQKFLEEVQAYPEQLYPEMFAFLNLHPGLATTPGNKAKFEALEKYFYPFLYVFSNDKHYSFSPDLKVNPCPLVFCLTNEKKNTLSFTFSNVSKKNFEFSFSEAASQDYLSFNGKKPVKIKAGSSVSLKFAVNLQKLKADSVFKTVHLVFADPAQPRTRIMVPVLLLPSRDNLELPPHFYDLAFSYSTYFKHISLQKEKSSWPESCPGNDCDGEIKYPLRSPWKLMSQYKFGDLCTIQYNMTTRSYPLYTLKSNTLGFIYRETGSIAGAGRNCPGTAPGTEVYCPPGTPNNGKEIYGSRKIEFSLFLTEGKFHELKIELEYSDLVDQPQQTNELSWLQEKKLLVQMTDQKDKLLLKEFIKGTRFTHAVKNIPPGIYKVTIYPAQEDSEKHKPSFNIQHLNHEARSRFEFALNGSFYLTSLPVTPKKK